eukprot:415425_1
MKASTESVDLDIKTRVFLKGTQLIYGSANACYYSFLSIWLSHNDFTYSQIGYIRGLNQLSILIFVPALCLIVDLISNTDHSKRECLFSIICVSCAIARLAFIFWDHSFNIIFCFLIIATIALQETANSTMDSILLSIIPNKNKYGRYRLWAGIGWGLVAFCLGVLFDYYLSIDSMFYFFALFMGFLGLIWFFPSITHLYIYSNCNNNQNNQYTSSLFVNEMNTKPTITFTFCGKLWLFFSQLNIFKLQIIFSFLVLGISFGVINTYLFLRLQELGASTLLMGLTLIVTTCSEFPAFWFVEYVLVNIGDLGIVTVSLFAYMIRLRWYGLLGLDRFTNPCQGFLSAIFNGIGQGIGGVVGGIIFNKYGPHYLFFGNALGLLPFFTVFALQFCFCDSKLRVNQTKLNETYRFN